MSGTTATAAARTIVEPIPRQAGRAKPAPWPYLFFFISGFPALLYQIVWQRSLFTFYGVNIESVTMVVTAFMLGLGLGSLFGGAISRTRRSALLPVFGATEVLIAGYGVFSLRIFHWAAEYTAGSAPLRTGLIAFALVVFPTVLMGSTLPILVSYAVGLSQNVGTSVGGLYAANTLGSASACFCAAWFLMRWLGESRTVWLAAGVNLLVGCAVLAWHFRTPRGQPARGISRGGSGADADSTKFAPRPPAQPRSAAGGNSRISFALAVPVAGFGGFIALGYEIVWYRMFSFTSGGAAKSFSFLLGAYLAGIALGSLACHRVCRRMDDPLNLRRLLVGVILGGSLLSFLVGPILFWLVGRVSYLWALLPIALAAAFLGAVFPLLCQVSIAPDERAGSRTSHLYLSNIVGSALGSYLTGSVLMDALSLARISVALALLGLALGAVLLLKAQLGRGRLLFSLLGMGVAAVIAIQGSGVLFHDMYRKMWLKDAYSINAPGGQVRDIVENKSGVIMVTRTGTIYGGGVYDGRFNTSLVEDSNGIQRVFALSYFHPNPREVLMIGLSSGSWAQVIANHPQVERLTIVEINPGYLPLIARNAYVASLLRNPKVQIEIDDGRRWLVRNPGRKFDAVIMNTSYSWRSSSTNLLSEEFLRLVRPHLNPGGVHFYNATESAAVMATGLNIFPFGMRVGSFLAVSDSPLQLDAQRWRSILLQYRIDGKPVFDLAQGGDRRRLAEVMSMPATMNRATAASVALESADHLRDRTIGMPLITDDNMGEEWLR